MVPLESRMPAGWVFFSSDASTLNSYIATISRNFRKGYVSITLVRDLEGQYWWHSLNSERQEDVDLYVTGTGDTFEDALLHAIDRTGKAELAPNLKAFQEQFK